MRGAKRIETLPPYLFASLDRKLAAKRAEIGRASCRERVL